MLRIAINAWFIEQPTTGSGQYLVHLLNEFLAAHPEHRFLLCGPAGSSYNGPGEWQTLPTPLDRAHAHLAKVWFEQVAFPRACKRWRADLIHVPYWGSPLRCDIPVVVTVHDLIPLLLPAYRGSWQARLYTRLVSASARRAALVLTDSQASRRDIVQHLGIPAERIDAIWLAAAPDFHPIRDGATIQRVREKYALNGRYLLYLAGFDVRKNVPGLLDAFARLDAPLLQLVIGGKLPQQDRPFSPDPRRIARELGIADRVHFTGWVDQKDKPAMYSDAIALVFPSLYEGFGLPPLEAMSCGTPVIVGARGSLPEIVGRGGLCVDPEDIDALAEAMRKLVVDDALRTELSAGALAQAKQFSWRATARQTWAAYRRALDTSFSLKSSNARMR